MPPALPLRSDFDSRTLRGLARRCQNSNQSRRLLSLAGVYDGMSRTEAAKIGGMDRQTLRRWVLRFNQDGPKAVSYTHLRAHETDSYLVCRLLLEKKKKTKKTIIMQQPHKQ